MGDGHVIDCESSPDRAVDRQRLVGRAVGRGRALWLAACGRRLRFRVSGTSMAPTLEPGDRVLVDPRAYRRHTPRSGDLVLARHPFRAGLKLIKRVTAVSDDGGCSLAGDNPEASTDSRIFGAVPVDSVLGRVVALIR